MFRSSIELSEHIARRARLGIAQMPGVVRIKPPPPKERDVLLLSAPEEPVDAPEPMPCTVLPQAHWRVIVREVCEKHRIPLVDLMSIRRAKPIVQARQEAMYRMRHETTLSYPQIGQRLGGRDHTTVLHGIKRHTERIGGEG